MTDFQTKCLKVIERSLNGMNSSWTIAVIVFGERWENNPRGRAGMVKAVQDACDKMVGDGTLACRLPPRDQFSHPVYCTKRFGGE